MLVACGALASLLASSPAALASSHRILSPVELDEPVLVAAPAGDPRLFVVERDGRILVYSGRVLLPTPFLDIRDRVDTQIEGGLLGLAFPPDFAATRAFYVYYTADGPNAAHPLTSRISRFRASLADPDQADPAEKVLLSLDQPDANHNGGTVAFGHDGYLYFGFGDGGGGGDPLDAAQDGDTLLGKLIRLDVSFDAFGDDYAIPPDNPFVADPAVRDEVWALGLRNPFRFSFDRTAGDLYIADVGQSSREEIDVEPDPSAPAADPGRNYGWDVMEGTACFDDSEWEGGPDPGEPPCNDPSLTLPVHEYAHASSPRRCSVTGGVVYRGSEPSLQGRYLFADWCSGELWSLLWDGAGSIVGPRIDHPELAPDQGSIDSPVGFGEDGFGEAYLVDQDGEVFRLAPEPSAPLLLAAGAAVLALAARFLNNGV